MILRGFDEFMMGCSLYIYRNYYHHHDGCYYYYYYGSVIPLRTRGGSFTSVKFRALNFGWMDRSKKEDRTWRVMTATYLCLSDSYIRIFGFTPRGGHTK